MRNIIEKVLKIDETYRGGGEIGYSWTTWCIVTEMLKERIGKDTFSVHLSQVSHIVTEADV